MPRGIDTSHDPNRRADQEGITNRVLGRYNAGGSSSTRYWSHPDEDLEQDRIERKQEQYREEGWDWGV